MNQDPVQEYLCRVVPIIAVLWILMLIVMGALL